MDGCIKRPNVRIAGFRECRDLIGKSKVFVNTVKSNLRAESV